MSWLILCVFSSPQGRLQPQLQLQSYPNYAKRTIESVEQKQVIISQSQRL